MNGVNIKSNFLYLPQKDAENPFFIKYKIFMKEVYQIMMKKRLMAMFLAAAMAVGAVGCGGSAKDSNEETKMHLMTKVQNLRKEKKAVPIRKKAALNR